MYNIKEFKLIGFVITLFTWVVTNLIFLPIWIDIKSIWAILATIVAVTTLSIIIETAIRKALNEFIIGEIKRYRRKHVNDFFDYMERDARFNKDVLREDIPLYDDERKKIGMGTVYGQISTKRRDYVNTLD
jgi:hypothetical protein